MDRRCGSPCAWLVMVLALLTHVAELVFSSLLAYALYRDVTQRDVFFSLTAGVVILPLVLVQLLSALFLLRRRGDSMRGGEAAGMGVLHVLQLAFLWRHLALIRKPTLLHKHELRELFVLRLTFTFAGGFPLLLIQTYLLLGTRAALVWPWAAHASLAATALSVTFTLTSAQRVLQEEGQGQGQGQDVTLCSWPAWLFTCVWRVGEVVSRTVCLALFAALYHQWVLLVLGLHWLVMLLCLSLPQSSAAGSGSSTSSSSARRVAVCVVTSYSYVWCYVSLSDVRAAVWYTVYYVIMFLENCTLGIVWLTKTEEQSFTARYLWVLVSTLAFLVSTACLLVVYRHFHLLPPPLTPSPSLTTSPSPPRSKNGLYPCPTCRHAVKKHHQQHQHCCTQRQPGAPSERSGQYGSALLTGQYYKHHLHDSLLDSASERNSAPPGWSHHHAALQGQGERCACSWRGEGDGVSVVSCQTSRSASSCPHHHHPHHHHRHRGGVAGTTKTSRSDITDSTSVLTLASGASHNLGYEGSDDTQSNTVPAWLPTGESLIAKHLMIADMAGPGVAPPPDPDKEWTQRQKRCMERYRCLLKQEAERWGSEGYPPSHQRPHHPGVPDWPKVSRAALTTSPTWDLPPGDPPCCQGCSCGHHSHLSPGDSEVSSIFRAAHLHPPCCDREGGGGDAGLGGIPGHLPPHHHHHHHLHRHQHCKDSPSSSSDSEDSEMTCPCCQKQQQHPHHHPHHHQQQQGRQYHSQPSIFTLSPQDPPCCRPGRREPAHDKRCVSDSEGLRRKQHQGGGLKKAKHPDKRRPRDPSTGRTRKRDAASPARTNPLERRQHEPAPGNVAEVKDQAAPRHVPSKLQVKAIAEKSDEDGLPISSTSPRSPEPIYENMVVCLEENNQPCVEQNNQKTSTSSHQTSQYAVNKDEDTLKICRDNKVYMNTTTQESAHTKHTTSTTKHQGKNNKEDIFISDSFVSDSTRRKDHHHKDKKAAKRDASPAKTVHERNSADREKLEGDGNQKRWGGSGVDKPQRRRDGGVPGVGMGKEAWYMCSESEDSALPPETFSSSGLEEEEGGGMTASDLDSDISFELII